MVCKKCGTEIDVESKFCSKCGTKKGFNFENKESLESVFAVIKETERGLADENRTIETSALKDALTRVNEELDKKKITKNLWVAGGALGGAFFLGLPITIFALGSLFVWDKISDNKLIEKKQELFSECKTKEEEIQHAMDWGNISDERKKYFFALMALLDVAIKLLEEDLNNK